MLINTRLNHAEFWLTQPSFAYTFPDNKILKCQPSLEKPLLKLTSNASFYQISF